MGTDAMAEVMINQLRDLNNLVTARAVKLDLAYFSPKVKHRLRQPGALTGLGNPEKFLNIRMMEFKKICPDGSISNNGTWTGFIQL